MQKRPRWDIPPGLMISMDWDQIISMNASIRVDSWPESDWE